MRIAQLCYLYEPAIGGVETHVRNLSRQLVRLGHSVDVYTSDFLSLSGQQRIGPKEEVLDGVRVHRKRGFALPHTSFYGQPVAFPGLILDLWRNTFDVVHCHSIPSNHFDLAWLMRELKGAPLFVTAHYNPGDLDTLQRARWAKLYWDTWMRLGLKRITKLIAIVSSEKERFIRYWGVPVSKIAVVPNGIDPEELDSVGPQDAEAFRQRLGLAGCQFILFVGRIVYAKGIDLLIQASLPLFERYDDLHLLVVGPVGNTAYFQTVRGLVDSHPLGTRVHFLQLRRREVLCAFKAARVVVLPSRGEVFGITLVEGMYCRKLVIGSNSGGIPEVVQHSETGLLFQSGDPDDLRDKLRCALEDTSALTAIREKAHRTAVKRYNWQVIARQVLDLYLEAQQSK